VGAQEGTAGLGERKPLKRRCQAERAGKKAYERKGFGKPYPPPSSREKALEREAQERGELKQAPESDTAYAAKRVAKP
jgi:hypothetical protein